MVGMRFSLHRIALVAFALALTSRAAVAAPTLHLVGDSTMADKKKSPPNPETGWGQALPAFFRDSTQVKNYAADGRSTKSFIDEGRWAKVVAALQAGDFVIIQFGHNDEKADRPDVYAASRGAYRDNLRRLIRDVREHGAVPILATSVARRKWNVAGDQLVETHGDYLAALTAVAVEQKVPLLELNRLTTELERAHGVEGSKKLHLYYGAGEFSRWPDGVKDDTHYSEYGAARVAALAVQEFLRLQLPLSTWLKDK